MCATQVILCEIYIFSYMFVGDVLQLLLICQCFTSKFHQNIQACGAVTCKKILHNQYFPLFRENSALTG